MLLCCTSFLLLSHFLLVCVWVCPFLSISLLLDLRLSLGFVSINTEVNIYINPCLHFWWFLPDAFLYMWLWIKKLFCTWLVYNLIIKIGRKFLLKILEQWFLKCSVTSFLGLLLKGKNYTPKVTFSCHFLSDSKWNFSCNNTDAFQNIRFEKKNSHISHFIL